MPQGRRIGPYLLLDVLGQGGMGVVYRARHDVTGQEAALKTVTVPRESMLQGIRREIHALARLRHPGIVRVLDEGLHEGLPWYAMELLEGEPLQEHCRRFWDPEQPEPGKDLPGLLELLHRLCLTLAYLHGEGLVHRDLKPANVLIRADGGAGWSRESAGTPVLLDFGVASRFCGELGREPLELGGALVGTLSYAAPEQIRGGLVDARADLYALGCTIYELLAGRPPFVRETYEELLLAHFEAEPVPLGELLPGLPRELEALVAGLLAKDPSRRIGHADTVAAALTGPGAGSNPVRGASRPYLYRPELCGREPLLQSFEERLERLESGEGGWLFLGGPSGSGKTRLASELARLARRRSLRVLLGEGSGGPGSPRGASGLQLLRGVLEAVADRCRARGLQETERLLGRRGPVLAEYEPGLQRLPGQDRHPAAAELPDEAARLRLYNCLAETLAALAQARPLVLVLDDLHLADELSRGFLDFWLASGWARKSAVLGVATHAAAEACPPELLRLLESRRAERIEIEALSQPAVEDMIAGMLALCPPPGALLQAVSSRARGNPFHVAELLRAAVAIGALARDAAGLWRIETSCEEPGGRLALPHSVPELAARRLEGLGPGARRVLEAASVLEAPFGSELLAGVAQIGELELLEAVAELLTGQWLEEPGPGCLRFLQEKLREMVQSGLDASWSQTLHRRAAGSLEPTAGATLGPMEQAARLGLHWAGACEPGRASAAYLKAARLASARHLHSYSERLYRAGLKCHHGDPEERLGFRLELARDVLLAQGKLHEAIAEAGPAAEEARGLGAHRLQAELLEGLGIAHVALGDLERAWKLAEEGLAAAKAANDRRLEGRILAGLGTIRHQQGRPAEALALYEAALEAHQATGDLRQEAVSLSNLAALRHAQGEAEACFEAYSRVMGLHRKTNNRRAEGLVLNNLALLHVDRGLLQEARGLYGQATEILREVGDPRAEALVLGNVAALCHALGEMDEARGLCEEALSIRRAIGDRRGAAHVLSNLGRLGYEQGSVDQALALYEEALALHRDSGNPRMTGHTLLHLAAERRLCRGALQEAEALLHEAETLLEETGDAQHRALCICQRGHLSLARGRPARSELARALIAAQGASSSSLLAEAAGRLKRAVEDYESGRTLCGGESLECLPTGLTRWLKDAGRLDRGANDLRTHQTQVEA